ncbi:N-acetylmuramoyl-L-alanine amidase [Candidatus Pelagibacter communis]|uniref:N-acetylmuramoyl-L-alanine amidase n=1 Tax=Pelagibacter ubique TaxID=198252 RepID=UPI00094C2EE1|nr:N-acetylmuramoyl-L-alanine amidase [Candidatus Pelagibacter ubique]|tara:strand:+ start:1159 stop:1893 length:735 start_codon:yes stop_codon:yes gene_type:complete
MWLKITNNYSPNFTLPKRRKSKIKFIILHYTGMKNESSAIKRLCSQKTNVSAHYFVKKNGDIINLVPDSYEAWHAGKSKWKNTISLNKSSIGIEIHNEGHEHKYKNFTPKQLKSLKKLLRKLIEKYKINLNNILGHSDIAPERKKDPGEKFPWEELAKSNLVKWHKINHHTLKNLRLKKLDKKQEIIFIKNLNIYGYKKIEKLNYDKSKKLIVKAFQRHFRQSLINGKSDYECFMIIKNLLKPY